MNKIAIKIIDLLLSNNIIKETDKNIYVYGMELMLTSVSEILFILLISIIAGNFVETSIFLAVFLPIRIYAGGYHADTRLRCFLIFVGVYILFSICIHILDWKQYEYAAILISVINIISVTLFAPLKNKNKKLTDAEVKKYKRISILLSVIAGSVIILLSALNRCGVSFGSVSLALFTVLISLITGKIKNFILERGFRP